MDLKVNPTISQEPSTITFEAIIPAEEGNNVACIVVDSESYYSSSCWELAGAEDRAVHRKTFKDLPAGHYVAVLNVDRGGKVSHIKREFIVIRRVE